MITTALKHGDKCYWKRNDAFTTVYFEAIHDMPAHKALTIRHNSVEWIVKDCEVFTEKQRFESEYHFEINAMREAVKPFTKIDVAKTLNKPYSRILRVVKKCKKFGIPL